MIKSKTVSVVVPVYNEKNNITKVIETMPSFVDKVIVVDDASTDNTREIVKKIAKKNRKVVLLTHPANQGVGGAIVSGYKYSRQKKFHATAVMAGDGQMNPHELRSLVTPIINSEADYSKGNRYLYGDAWKTIPKVRYLGNAVLSMLTKIASGYWWVADSQTGYTVISRWGLEHLNLDALYTDYGFPNDMLVKLNAIDARVSEIPIEPIYGQGEKSKMKIVKVIPRISWLLFRLFIWRLKEKYIIRNFHPLLFFYTMGILLSLISIPLLVRLITVWIISGHIPSINTLAYLFCITMASQSLMFAMWFDMEYNKFLNANLFGNKTNIRS